MTCRPCRATREYWPCPFTPIIVVEAGITRNGVRNQSSCNHARAIGCDKRHHSRKEMIERDGLGAGQGRQRRGRRPLSGRARRRWKLLRVNGPSSSLTRRLHRTANESAGNRAWLRYWIWVWAYLFPTAFRTGGVGYCSEEVWATTPCAGDVLHYQLSKWLGQVEFALLREPLRCIEVLRLRRLPWKALKERLLCKVGLPHQTFVQEIRPPHDHEWTLTADKNASQQGCA